MFPREGQTVQGQALRTQIFSQEDQKGRKASSLGATVFAHARCMVQS